MSTAGTFEGPRGPYRLALGTVAATWLLLAIGGLVNPTGSSLACPDWYFVPTCFGKVVPDDWSGGVLYEHGHRLWASLVGMLTVALAVWAWRARGVDGTTRRLALLAAVLVAVQGTLGGITVKLGLSWVVSTLHLTLANVFFCLLIVLAARLRPVPPVEGPAPGIPRGPVLAAAALVLLQVVLGGLVRHLGAGLACGDDWLLCGPRGIWPDLPEAKLQLLHRAVGYSVALAVFAASAGVVRRARLAGRSVLARIAKAPRHAVVLQILLGIVTVATGRNLVAVTLHTAVAGLLLGSLVVVWLSLSSPARPAEATT